MAGSCSYVRYNTGAGGPEGAGETGCLKAVHHRQARSVWAFAALSEGVQGVLWANGGFDANF
jgi:hypothetical protein